MKRTMLDIMLLVKEFYALEALYVEILLGNDCFEPFRHSHARWNRDFQLFRDAFIQNLAAAIYDYTVLVVAGELRHGNGKATYKINRYYRTDDERNRVYYNCLGYRDTDILNAGVRMFDCNIVDWRNGYGGDAWKDIAKAGLMKGKVKDSVFIDHCVDLSHNSNVYFDKGAGIFMLTDAEKYRQFLDLKYKCAPITLLTEFHGEEYNQLMDRACNLGMYRITRRPQPDAYYRELAEANLFEYKPIKWGNAALCVNEENISYTNVSVYRSSRDGDDDDYDSERERAPMQCIEFPKAA